MWVFLSLATLGLFLGVRIQNRLGAAFLLFSAISIIHVLLETGPRLIDQSPWGRRVASGAHLLSRHGAGAMPNLILAAYAGLAVAWLIGWASQERRSQRSGIWGA